MNRIAVSRPAERSPEAVFEAVEAVTLQVGVSRDWLEGTVAGLIEKEADRVVSRLAVTFGTQRSRSTT